MKSSVKILKRKTTAKATKFKGRASTVKLKKNMEHMLSKEQHNVLSYFLKGEDASPEHRTEAMLSVGSVVPGALVNSSGGKCPAHCASCKASMFLFLGHVFPVMKIMCIKLFIRRGQVDVFVSF